MFSDDYDYGERHNFAERYEMFPFRKLHEVLGGRSGLPRTGDYKTLRGLPTLWCKSDEHVSGSGAKSELDV